jgi:hypothetical protein
LSEPQFPNNFSLLHKGEEELRAKGIEAIEASEDMEAPAVFIESSMSLIEYLSRQYDTSDPNELLVQHLGARLFNGGACALNLLLAGYYQNSALIQRDMLETLFLLDFFTLDKSAIARWRDLPPKERWKEFGPAKIREKLDKRDGFTTRRRQADYDLLCELAGHPTPQGFVMLKPSGMDAHVEPFFDNSALGAVLSELAKHIGNAAAQINCLCATRQVAHFGIKIAFVEAQHRWLGKFFGRQFDQTQLDEMKRLFAAYEKNQS